MLLKGLNDKENNDLNAFLKQYSLDDLAKSFFVLNMWLPNISSQIKFQYLYSSLEEIHVDLANENKIKSYQDFQSFCEELFKILPSFSMLEDYVPEMDWKDIRYFFKKKFYKIFYGGDLSNPYDFYYAYEIMHTPFEDQYIDLIERSPTREMQFVLEMQNDILEEIPQEKTAELEEVMPGDMKVPSDSFWVLVSDYINQFDPESIYSIDILKIYTHDLKEVNQMPSWDTFIDNGYRGKNCRYLLIKKGNKYYPTIPRKWLTVVYDTWGLVLRNNYSSLEKKLDGKKPYVLMSLELSHFILERMKEDKVFQLVTPLGDDLKPVHDLKFTSILAGEKLFMMYMTPPVYDGKAIGKHLERIWPKIKQSKLLLEKSPTRLGLLTKGKTVEFRHSKSEKVLQPIFLIVLPCPLSEGAGGLRVPKGLNVEVITVDQIAGLIDEIEEPEELEEFFEYVAEENKSPRIVPLNSYLDRFASFKDSHGVLVPGAVEPNIIMLDFNWGSNYRFKKLKEFWNLFPDETLFGPPRSWVIPEERRTKTGFVLHSKTFMGYAYYQKVNASSFFINAPVHLMSLEDGRIVDSMMHSLFDIMDLYSDILKKLSFTGTERKVQVFFCPSNVADTQEELDHLRHLSPQKELWKMDCARMRPLAKDYGVRVVYNPILTIEALKQATDRSLQVQLLIDVLDQLNILMPDPNLETVKKELENEKGKIVRFKISAIEKRTSFPEGISEVLPGEREYKLADKEISKIALELGIEPGTYSAKDAQGKLNSLRSKLVLVLNEKISKFTLHSELPLLLEKSNVLVEQSWRSKEGAKVSLEHEVDYERSEKSSEDEKKFLHWYRTYRYLIEKFVHLQPSGKDELDIKKLKEVLAFIDRLLDLYVASDFINYEIYPVSVEISTDYIVSTRDDKNDIRAMEKAYGEEQAKINLGFIGNNEDTADSTIPVEEYLDELDIAFKKDLGFSLKNFVNVQKVMAIWAVSEKVTEASYYAASRDQIKAACMRGIIGFNENEIDPILNFLTLKPEEILRVKDNPVPTEDVPVWEHNKRLMRYDLKPLIKIGTQYYWGPHSIDRTSMIWMGISSKHRLPSDIDAVNVKAILNKGHVSLQNNLVKKAEEIALRYTKSVLTNVYPHKHEDSLDDIGDCDVLVYLKEKNILLNIECKIIAPPFSNKDAGRMQRTIFGGISSDGSPKKGYLQPVEDRGAYLKLKGKELMSKLSWHTSVAPEIVSVFVTKMGFWWTKHPPLATEVEFVEIRCLDDFIKGL